jgi:outer membrane receptor protein involved in Fe transport
VNVALTQQHWRKAPPFVERFFCKAAKAINPLAIELGEACAMSSSSTLWKFSLSASAVALATALTTPAYAQTEQQQSQAQQQNTAVDCSTITDPARRATCQRTQGQNAPAVQGAPAEGTIIVTGSRIPKPNYDTVQPSVVLNSTAIEERGFVNAADALNELPQFGVPGSGPIGNGQGGAFGTGQSFVNFLGLGSQRTLVLVNGRRFVSSNTPSLFGPTNGGALGNEGVGEQVDLGQINTKLIDRIETIAIGGAPIYGSDAIAGTINIILKHDYQGIDIDGEDGVSYYGEGHNWRVRALVGHNFFDGRANLTASAEYNKGDGFTYQDAPAFYGSRFYDNCNPGSQFNQCLYNNIKVNATIPGGVPLVGSGFGLDFGFSPLQGTQLLGAPVTTGVTDAAGNNVIFDEHGQLIEADYGVNPGGADNFTLFSSGGNGFDYIATGQALSDTERYNANLLGHYDVNDNVKVFGEAWYSHSKSTNLGGQPEYNSGIFAGSGTPGGSLILSVNNPFLTPAQRALIIQSIQTNPLSDLNCPFGPNFGPCPASQDYFYLSRANIDIPTQLGTFADNLYRFVIGVDGKFKMLAGDWNWEVSGNWGHSHSVGKAVDINVQNFNNAVGEITADNPGGVPCLAGLENSPFPTLSSTCVPFNPFGSGKSSQALDYFLSRITNISDNRQFVANGYVSGPLFRLPGGNLSLVLGAEHRAEGTNNEPSAFYHGPDADPTVDENGDGDPTNDAVSYGQSVPILPIKGGFHTNEIFGELNGDLVSPSNNVPMIYSLDFQAAARYVHHSVSGNAVTWTVGSRYAPIRDISFRGNFTHAIRSPSIQETFIPTSTFFGFAVDPCDADQLVNGPNPATRQANCAAAGIPTDFASNAASRSFLQSRGGNPDLQNEVANSFSIGTVLRPRFVRGLNLSVDYIRVKLKNAISAFSGTQILNACYDAPNPASNPFCSLFTRDASTDQLTFIQTSFFNASEYEYRGIITSWDWKFNTPFLGAKSSLDFSGSYQRLLQLTQVPAPGAAESHFQGTLGYPKNSFSATVNYVNGPVTLFSNFNYTGSVFQTNDEPANFREHAKLSSVMFTNVGFRIDVGQRFRFFGDVDNVFNVGVPFPAPTQNFGGAVTYFPGVLGRYFRFGAGVHF